MAMIKKLERLARDLFLKPRVFVRYGCFRPSRVKLHNCDHWVHIDPTDRRATKKLVYDPIRGRVSPPSGFWRAFNDHLQPAVAVDVGVNFGECLFGCRYAPQTHVFGFEANPRIAPFLTKSRDQHPEGERITLTYGLVSDEAAEEVPFFVDPSWSGGGSAVARLNEAADTLAFTLTARTLDSVIPRQLVAGKCLLFKMDIEGYEVKAFRGFGETLDAAALAVGFIEFDSSFITAAGESPENYFESLARRFDIYRLDGSSARKLLRVEGFSALPPSRAPDGRVHTDLILVTPGAAPTTWLAPGWACD